MERQKVNPPLLVGILFSLPILGLFSKIDIIIYSQLYPKRKLFWFLAFFVDEVPAV